MDHIDPEKDKDVDLARVRAALQTLMEHFDSVQIFANRFETAAEGADGTVTINLGDGNWFARRGQVLDWCVEMNEHTKVKVRKNDDE